MTRNASRFIAVVLLSIAAAVPAGAQTPVSRESQLVAQTNQFPRDLSPYLELARLYFEQGRFEDSERVLSQAISAVQRVRATSLSRQDAFARPSANRTMLSGVDTAYPPDTVRVGGDIREPKKMKDVKPVYPEIAQASKVSGIVIIEALIDRDGSVASARVLRSVPLLDQAAVDAVRQWMFTPTLLNGAPVPVLMTVTVNFTLQ
jgi:TonB family protein